MDDTFQHNVAGGVKLRRNDEHRPVHASRRVQEQVELVPERIIVGRHRKVPVHGFTSRGRPRELSMNHLSRPRHGVWCASYEQ